MHNAHVKDFLYQEWVRAAHFANLIDTVLEWKNSVKAYVRYAAEMYD